MGRKNTLEEVLQQHTTGSKQLVAALQWVWRELQAGVMEFSMTGMENCFGRTALDNRKVELDRKDGSSIRYSVFTADKFAALRGYSDLLIPT